MHVPSGNSRATASSFVRARSRLVNGIISSLLVWSRLSRPWAVRDVCGCPSNRSLDQPDTIQASPVGLSDLLDLIGVECYLSDGAIVVIDERHAEDVLVITE